MRSLLHDGTRLGAPLEMKDWSKVQLVCQKEGRGSEERGGIYNENRRMSRLNTQVCLQLNDDLCAAVNRIWQGACGDLCLICGV
jgi:hypothetical protein